MPYNQLEDRYLNSLAELEFPTVPPQPMLEEAGLDGMQLAMGGGAGQYRKDLPMTDVGMGMLDMGAATVKGVTQGFVGLPGDLEAIAYGIKEIVSRPEGEGKLEAFLRGIDQKTIMPTTEEVKTWLDKNVGMVGDGKNPYESIGEVLAPGGQIKAGKATVKGMKKAGAALAPKVGEMAEDYLRRTGGLMDVAPPRVDSIDKFPIGPGSIKPHVIAQDKPLHREMSAENLMDFLRNDKQFSYAPVFVADNADLAIGQGSNAGVKVKFRANSVSGEEHRKPMTGDIAGREYQADVFAPMAIESITFASEADLKKVKSVAARVLQTDFERVTDGKKNVVFVRKVQGEEKK